MTAVTKTIILELGCHVVNTIMPSLSIVYFDRREASRIISASCIYK